MTTVLTLVSPTAFEETAIAAFKDRFGAGGTASLGPCAVDLTFAGDPPTKAAVAEALGGAEIDFCLQAAAGRQKKLLIADMDSTIIEQECLDELADMAGKGAEVSAITERAMRGELDFEGALTERVGMLNGLGADTCARVMEERLSLSPGARVLVQTMAANGAHTMLVSGGFDIFVSAIAEKCGFAQTRANSLIVEDGALTGDVGRPILGREAKLEALQEASNAKGLNLSETLAVGDGANDLAMIEAAGLGVAYKAKPVVAEAAAAAIRFTDLTTLLYFQGYHADTHRP